MFDILNAHFAIEGIQQKKSLWVSEVNNAFLSFILFQSSFSANLSITEMAYFWESFIPKWRINMAVIYTSIQGKMNRIKDCFILNKWQIFQASRLTLPFLQTATKLAAVLSKHPSPWSSVSPSWQGTKTVPSAEEFKLLKKNKSSFKASFTEENCKIHSITREEAAREGGGAVAFAFAKWRAFLRDFKG